MSLQVPQYGLSRTAFGGCAIALLLVAALAGGLHAQTPAAIPPAMEDHPPVPVPPPPKPSEINRDLLKFIEDDAPVRGRTENDGHEALAYEYLFTFARQVQPADMAKAVRKDITFGHMFGSERGKYRGEVVRVEGRLRRLRRFDPPSALQADGIPDLYEAWIFPDSAANNPVCVVFSQLPAGLELGDDLRRYVRFDAFFFKLYRYRAGDSFRRAPLLIGAQPILTDSVGSPMDQQWANTGQVVGIVFAGCVVALGAGWVLALWFRREDAKTRALLLEARNRAQVAQMDRPPSERSAFESEPSIN